MLLLFLCIVLNGFCCEFASAVKREMGFLRLGEVTYYVESINFSDLCLCLFTLSLLSVEVLNKIGNWDAIRLLLVSNKLILLFKVHLQSVI